ncbi:hypothetical protein FQV27_14270 [Paracoccus aurantiacus]|uniref:Flagellin C-terminal domain-containing protein n=1 Tax=Paracoccus aurantiacus TaxID=2599412 RepID=A0A5C6S072_9RHOB|nr:flagellin [Paracoccus aurantiacus]TXB67763.1 hypothetical protein FQV27_14270 [Paracoccus aurantiacus]
MNFVSVGDLSRIFTLRGSNAALRSDIERLSQEVTTGIRADIPKHLGGDLVQLAKIEDGLSQASAYRQVASEAASTASAMQTALGTLQDLADVAGGSMLSDTSLAVSSSLKSVATATKGQLHVAVAALNTNIGGRFVFSGTKVNLPPLASGDNVLAQAKGAISGATDAESAVQMLRTWFNAPPGAGGFADNAYRGAVSPAAEFGVDSSTSVKFDQTANDSGVRDILFGLTLGALVADGAFTDNHDARASMMRAGGAALIAGNASIAQSRSDLGMTEQIVERSKTRLESMMTNLKIERTCLIEADSYEAGSRLIEAEAQLEALFALTARLSNLSLAKYL